MKPETLFAIYTIVKAFFLGWCAYAVWGWPLFLSLPAGLFFAFIPLVSDGAAIYLGAKALGIPYWMAAVGVLLAASPFILWMLFIGFDIWRDGRKKKEKKMQLSIEFKERSLAMVKMAAGSDVTVKTGAFFCFINTDDETTVICRPEDIPAGAAEVNEGWCAFKVQGPLDFSMVGVMANLSGTMAKAGISVIPVSTFDTDWILVRCEKAEDAAKAWKISGHTVKGLDHDL